jgi:hypothetical protein
MDFINAFKLRLFTPNKLKEYVLVTLSNYKEQFEHEQHILQHLPEGLMPIQSVSNIEDYIELHSKEGTPADEFIIKTLSRTFKLNFMIITSNGNNAYDTLISEHRHEIHLDNTSIIIQRNNLYYPTKRIIRNHNRTESIEVIDEMETTSSGGAERTATSDSTVKIEDMKWEAISKLRDTGNSDFYQVRTTQKAIMHLLDKPPLFSKSLEISGMGKASARRVYENNDEPIDPWPCDQPHSLLRSTDQIITYKESPTNQFIQLLPQLIQLLDNTSKESRTTIGATFDNAKDE